MNTSSLETLLQELPVFSRLTPPEHKFLESVAVSKSYASGNNIAFQGDIWPHAFILQKGEVVVQKLSTEGRSLGSLRLSSRQMFWSPSLFDGNPLPATLETSRNCLVFLWNQEHIMPVIQKNHLAMWDLCVMLTQRMRHASGMVEDLAFQPVASRLARLLVKQFDESPKKAFERSLSLDDMAAMIGTTPVMVCKLLSRFAEQGVIKVSRSEFEFIDHKKLGQIAGHLD